MVVPVHVEADRLVPDRLVVDVSVGQTCPLRYFGDYLVAYRGDGGELHVMQAHCPHFGVGIGHVVDVVSENGPDSVHFVYVHRVGHPGVARLEGRRTDVEVPHRLAEHAQRRPGRHDPADPQLAGGARGGSLTAFDVRAAAPPHLHGHAGGARPVRPLLHGVVAAAAWRRLAHAAGRPPGSGSTRSSSAPWRTTSRSGATSATSSTRCWPSRTPSRTKALRTWAQQFYDVGPDE